MGTRANVKGLPLTTKLFFLSSLVIGLFLFITDHPASVNQGCLSCHQGIESPGPDHRFPCERCHGGNPQADSLQKAHEGLIANPSSLGQAPRQCAPCHREQLTRVQHSLMATSAGEINQTRYLWGAQKDPGTSYLNRRIGPYPALPDFPKSGEMVDDLLRRRCLRCHLQTAGSKRYGEWRADGCAACHMPYGPDGLSQTKDKALRPVIAQIQKDPSRQKRGYPLTHQFTKKVPTQQCLTCHNGHRVGMDFVGLAEKDYERSYRFFSKDGEQPSLIYGFDPRRLTPDIHFEKGLTCIDCHTSNDAMGDGKVYAHSMEQVAIRCQDCHGTPRHGPRTKILTLSANGPLNGKSQTVRQEIVLDSKGNPLRHVRKEGKGLFLYSKSNNSKHQVPLLAAGPTALSHRIPGHIRSMECHSCHALWSYQDFGFHLIREERSDYEKWAPLWLQNDPQVQDLLRKNLPLKKDLRSPPLSRDYLNNTLSPGIWYSGWSYRRLESPIFGINERRRTSIFRPLHQFVVSQVDGKGRTLVDSQILKTTDGKPGLGFNPYAPHTIRRETLRCEGCHLNPRALGLGNRLAQEDDKGRTRFSSPLTQPEKDGLKPLLEWEAIVDQGGDPLQTQTRPGSRPYNLKELKGLMTKTKAYKGYTTLYFKEKGWY